MSLINDLIYFETPSLWEDFGGTSGGYGGLVWQVFIWSLIVGLIVFVWMSYNLIYFRHKEGDPEHKDSLKAGVFPHERGDVKVELAWTIAPLILAVWLTFISLAPLDYLWAIPEEDEVDIVIEVTASQWQWTFDYPDDYEIPEDFTKCGKLNEEGVRQQNERTTYDCLELPHSTMVRFNINSNDVLHAFYIPEIGVKHDAVPNIETLVWVDTGHVDPGEYNLYCAEYCGESHSRMLADIYITED
ncbi:MAG: cytochrome c oxidase subunit II [Candidatus Poseidoniia archaeon]|jgi:cytochrome c oxidase subunit 2|nr:cytochrome c oxidase subunit II [Candidatus Poseidoniia archaeon]